MQQPNTSNSYFPTQPIRSQSSLFNKRNTTLYSPIIRQRSRSPVGIKSTIFSSPYINTNTNTNLYNNNNNTSLNNPNVTPPNLTSQNIKKIVDDVYMYPNGFAQLLKNQQRNIKQFKIQINKQKQRIDQDLSSFKVQINHTLEDLRLSLHAHLDRVYQTYLQKAAKFRNQVFQINRLKQQLQIELGAASLSQLQSQIKMDTMNITNKIKNIPQRDNNTSQSPIQNTLYHSLNSNINSNLNQTPNINTNINNINTNINHNNLQLQNLQKISNMQIGNKQYKKYYILNYIAQLQKDRVIPLTDLQRQLIVLNLYQNGFYQSNQFIKVLGHLRDILNKQTRKIYDNNYLYIRDIDSLLIKDKQQNNKILDGLQLSPYTFKSVNNNNTVINNTGLGSLLPVNTINPLYTSPIPNPIITNINNINPINSPNKLLKAYQSNLPLTSIISRSQQSLRTQSTQNISLIQQPILIQLPNKQPILCAIYINNQIALGLKNGIIQIISCDGHPITTLKQHKTNICTLAIISINNINYLVSGSDVGCSKIIIWDPVTWQPKNILSGYHYAAITGIIDLQDNTHILSVSYDKKINIYNLQQNKLIYNNNNTILQLQSPITTILTNKSCSKLIGCGLDKIIYIWQIIRNYKLKVQNIILQRKIQNNSTISSIVSSQILQQFIIIITKDNKIKLVNIDKGQSYKTINIFNQLSSSISLPGTSSSYPLEMTIIQRDNKPYYPLVLVWPYKQHKIYQVNTQTTLVNIKNLSNNSATLQYGYGVNPKCFYINDGNKICLYTVDQRNNSNSNNCMAVYRVEQLK